jgi:hypothetical protein
MPKNEKPGEAIDWSLTTWDGSRRETLRRWAQLPLERVIAALEEMQELNDMLSESRAAAEASRPGAGSAVHEQRGDYRTKAGSRPATPQDSTPTGHHGSHPPDKKGGNEG